MFEVITLEALSLTAPKSEAPGTAADVCVNKPSLKDVLEAVTGVRVWGITPAEFLSHVVEQTEGAVDGKGQRLRKDAAVAVVGTASYPNPSGFISEDEQIEEAIYLDWQETLIRFLKAEFGDNLRSVIRHEDEYGRYRHVQFFLAEDKAPDGRFGVLRIHPGRAANARSRKEGEGFKDQKDAYQKAMSDFNVGYMESMEEWNKRHPSVHKVTRSDWNYAKTLRAHKLKLVKHLEEAARIAEAALVKNAADMKAIGPSQVETLREKLEAEIRLRVQAEVENLRLRREIKTLKTSTA